MLSGESSSNRSGFLLFRLGRSDESDAGMTDGIKVFMGQHTSILPMRKKLDCKQS